MNKTTELNFLGLPKRTWWCCELKQVLIKKKGGYMKSTAQGTIRICTFIMRIKLLLGTQTKWNPKNRIAWSKKINLKRRRKIPNHVPNISLFNLLFSFTMRRNLPKTFSVLKFWIDLLIFSLMNFWQTVKKLIFVYFY